MESVTVRVHVKVGKNGVFQLGIFPLFDELNADKDQAIKVLEEASEAREAFENMRKAMDANGPGVPIGYLRQFVLNELCDTCQAVANLLGAMEVTDYEWASTIERVNAGNADRGRIAGEDAY